MESKESHPPPPIAYGEPELCASYHFQSKMSFNHCHYFLRTRVSRYTHVLRFAGSCRKPFAQMERYCFSQSVWMLLGLVITVVIIYENMSSEVFKKLLHYINFRKLHTILYYFYILCNIINKFFLEIYRVILITQCLDNNIMLIY